MAEQLKTLKAKLRGKMVIPERFSAINKSFSTPATFEWVSGRIAERCHMFLQSFSALLEAIDFRVAFQMVDKFNLFRKYVKADVRNMKSLQYWAEAIALKHPIEINKITHCPCNICQIFL